MHVENLLFILLIAMAVLFRLLASKAGETKEKLQNPDQRSTTSPQLGESPRRARVESDEERIRKFLEALGQPASSRPPPPVAPRTNIPPRPLAPVQPPRIPTARNILTDRRRQVVETTKSSEPPRLLERNSPSKKSSPRSAVRTRISCWTRSTRPQPRSY